MIEVTEQSAQELTATPAMERTEITVRNPLLVARTWRAPTNEVKLRRSRASRISGSAAESTPSRKSTPATRAPKRVSSCSSLKGAAGWLGMRAASVVSTAKATPKAAESHHRIARATLLASRR